MATAVCSSCDRTFLPAACLAMMSAADSAGETGDQLAFFIFVDEGVTGKEIGKARRFLDRRHPQVRLVSEHGIDLTRYDSRARPNRAGFMRLHYHEYLEAAFTRIIQVDADMRFERSVAELSVLDLGPRPVGVVHDLALYAQLRVHQERTLAGLAPRGRYFNAGLMILDRTHCDAIPALSEATRLLADPRLDFPFEDQTALNAAFEGNWKPVDPAWNINDYLYRAWVEPAPHLLHFTSTKPWRAERSPDLDVFADWYREKTADSPWPDFVEPRTNRRDYGAGWRRRVRLNSLVYRLAGGVLAPDLRQRCRRDHLIATGRLREVYAMMRLEAAGQPMALDDPQSLFL